MCDALHHLLDNIFIKFGSKLYRQIVGTVSHFSYVPLFKGPHFSQKCWNRTFSVIIYLLTFYLFDDIKKNIGITHVNHSATPKAILTKVHDCTCNLNVYNFYLRFALGNIIQVNHPFSVVEISNTVTV